MFGLGSGLVGKKEGVAGAVERGISELSHVAGETVPGPRGSERFTEKKESTRKKGARGRQNCCGWVYGISSAHALASWSLERDRDHFFTTLFLSEHGSGLVC